MVMGKDMEISNNLYKCLFSIKIIEVRTLYLQNDSNICSLYESLDYLKKYSRIFFDLLIIENIFLI